MAWPAFVSHIHIVAKAFRLVAILTVQVGLVLPAAAPAGQADRSDTVSKAVLGVRNIPLKQGAEALLAGDYDEGIRLTHIGLQHAMGAKEHEAALSNLCAGYLQLGKYSTALQYCELLLARNEANWRGYNNRALIYIKTKQWEKAEADLIRGESLNAGAHTLKIARSMYMDAVHPVVSEIEIDDREEKKPD